MNKENLLMYDGVLVKNLKHIPEISCYNSNYYVGLLPSNRATNDLLYACSDDDNTTEWYLVEPYDYFLIGYSFSSDDPDERINYSACKYT